MIQMQDPELYKPEECPQQVAVRRNGACNQVGGRPDPHLQVPPNPGMFAQPVMPYGFYPLPNMYFPMHQPPWTSGVLALPSGFPPTAAPGFQPPGPSAPAKPVKCPAIAEWLHYCDHHPDREGAVLEALAWKFEQEGYRTIDQLTRMSVVDLSTWLDIGKGTADLLIQYANDDMDLVRNGTFKMESIPGSGDHWASRDI